MVRWALVGVCLGRLAVAASPLPGPPEKLIEQGHWKRARAMVEARIRQAPDDALANFLLSQIRNAFGDRESPLRLAEKAVALDGATAKYHRQLAEVTGVMAQHANLFQLLTLARRFRKEIDIALELDPRDLQALRDVMEFYLLAPGIAGGDEKKAEATADRIGAIDPAEGFRARARLAEFHKDTASVERWLRQSVDARPEDYRARMALAAFYLAPGRSDFTPAEEQAQAALAVDTGRVDAYAALAEVYAVRHEWNELDSVLTAGAKAVPDDLVPYYRAAVRLIDSGKELPRAGRYLRVYLSQEPEGNQPTAADARRKEESVLKKEGPVFRRAARLN